MDKNRISKYNIQSEEKHQLKNKRNTSKNEKD